MKILVVEDDNISRIFMLKFLSKYGECDVTVDGIEALDAYMIAKKDGNPYDLICLDIMMPKLDGIKTLKAIRDIETSENIEKSKRVKVIMVSALNDMETVETAFEEGCEAYASKPLNQKKLLEVMGNLKII